MKQIMTWFPWRRRKKKFDFNAYLVSQAKQQKQHDEYKKQQERLQNDISDNNEMTETRSSSFSVSLRRASVRAQSFSTSLPAFSRAKSFSLVLTDEDLKGLELQRKLETLRRQGEVANESYKQEIDILKSVLGQCKTDMDSTLKEGIDWSECFEIEQHEMSVEHKWREAVNRGEDDEGDTGRAVGSTSTVQGKQEADLMKAILKVELQDRTRRRLQEFTNEEVMRLYKMESTIKEEFAEREAMILSEISRMDARLGKIRECHQRRLEISEQMKARYEKANELHVERVYNALREQSEGKRESDEEGTVFRSGSGGDMKDIRRRRSSLKQSYSSRILAVDAQEREENRRMRESIRNSRTTVPFEEEEDHDHEFENENPVEEESFKRDQDNETAHSNEKTARCETTESATSSSSISSYPRTTGASRNTRMSANRSTRQSSTGSAASGTSAIAVARARAVAGRGGALVTGTKTATGPRITGTESPFSSPMTREQTVMRTGVTRPATTRSNLAPRRVHSGTSRK